MVMKRVKRAARKRAQPIQRKMMPGRAVSRMVEKKYVDVNSFVSPSTTVNMQLLNGTSAGTESTNRLGRNVYLETLILRYQLLNVDISVSAGAHSIRVICFIDKNPVGSTPGLSDLLRDVDNGSIQTSAYDSFQNRETLNRFTILHDNLINIPAYTLASGNTGFADVNPSDCSKKLTIKLNRKMQYNGTTATISSMQSNAIYLAVIDSIGGLTWGLYTQSRVLYTDM